MTDKVWTYAEMWESVAAALPDADASVQGDRRWLWGELDAAADALAAGLLATGLTQQSKVAVYAANCAEFMVAYYAAFKAGLVPFNVNYRYGTEEVAYLLDNGDAEAVVFETTYAAIVDAVRARLPGVRRWIAVQRGGVPVPDWAEDFATLTATPPAVRPVIAPWGRTNTDLMLLYTGGTTGMPKGVMWRQSDLIARGGYASNPLTGVGPLDSPDAAGARAAATPIRPRSLIACPLMHGTGMIAAFASLTSGGCVLLLPQGNFDATQLWDLAETERATRMSIVGQPFAQPMLEALDAEPGRWNLSNVYFIGSSGAMWSRENKAGLIAHMPQVTLVDSFSSSEAFGMGVSMASAAAPVETASFTLGPDCQVFDDDDQPVAPGSGKRGRVALGGYLPMGYYKDEAKTEKTFPTIAGGRWSVPGDWAEVASDGTLILLGRGSQCINTGGEKVFPEEVEEALKRHPAVRDAAVTGLPDPRFGERIAALVELITGADHPGAAALMDHVKAQLATYKAPRHILFVDSVARAPNGKLDYKAVKTRAVAAFQSQEAA